jgi:hypothetical protein
VQAKGKKMENSPYNAEKPIWPSIPLKQRETLAALLSSIFLSKPKENNHDTSQNTARPSQPTSCDLCSSIIRLSGSK